MRVLYVTQGMSPHDHRFLSALAHTPHQVHALSLAPGERRLEARPLPPQITHVVMREKRGGGSRVNLRSLLPAFTTMLRDLQPDLIHAGPVHTCAFLAALSGFRPLVSMSWGSDLLRDIDLDLREWYAAKYALQRSAVLAADCLAVQHKAVRMGFPAERVVVFPWGVDLRTFSPARRRPLRQRLGWQDAFVLISVRSWEPIYGVETVVRAFARAAQHLPDLRLLLLGDGSLAEHIRALIKALGLEQRVHLTGRMSNDALAEYYRAADLYVSASLSDGSSVSLLEALACGVPALVSDIPSNREWVSGDVVGGTFPPEDAGALAQEILNAARKREQLPGMAKAARRLAEQRADWSKNFARLLDAYEMAVQIGAG